MGNIDEISKETTSSWYLINVKARRNQYPMHYVDAFEKIKKEDPLIDLKRKKSASIKSLSISEISDNYSVPQWVTMIITSYTIIDPESFYNRRSQEDIKMDWDEDIVANKNEAELILIPSVHTVAVRKHCKISINSIITYLAEALNTIEPDGFDVTQVTDAGVLNKILSAHSILSIEAKVSYSNHSHTDSFIALFDDKVNEADASSLNITLRGSSTHPLNNTEDGLINAVVNMAERDGIVKAKVIETEGAKETIINSSEHPKIVLIKHKSNNLYTEIYKKIRSLFHSKTNG